MRIGIDIDNTICQTSKLAMELYKKENETNDDFASKDKQYEFIKSHGLYIFNNCILHENAKDVINKLYKENEIYLITARNNKHVKGIKRATLNYLKSVGISYNGIYFGCSSKLNKCEKLRLDVMLDDDPNVYEELLNTNINCILFDGVLNEKYRGRKVSNWLEFNNLIERMMEGGK